MIAPDEKFKTLVQNKKILVVDTSPRVLEFNCSLLQSMGAPTKQIIPALDFLTAKAEIEKNKPDIILSDYDLDRKCGLLLLQAQRQQADANGTGLFVLVTGNTSQMAIARAAEEEVDGYVVKPFTGSILRESILKAAASRFEPNEYERTIQKAKKLIDESRFDEAQVNLEKARTLHPQPALALCYLGKLEQARKNFPRAQEYYLQGLRQNRIHYKCMVGLYEVLMEQKLYSDAYAVIKRMSHYFPADGGRLTTMLKLSILTRNYDDVERCYLAYNELDSKSEELTKYVCAALVVCGKFYLQKNFRSRCLDLFQKAAKTAGKNVKIIREVILTLLEFELWKEAEEYLKWFPPQARSSADFHALSLCLANHSAGANEIIAKGRELLEKDVHDPLIYEILIKRTGEISELPSAVAWAKKATERWPHLKDKFNRLVEQLQQA